LGKLCFFPHRSQEDRQASVGSRMLGFGCHRDPIFGSELIDTSLVSEQAEHLYEP
jgi:hypothetical protein